MNNKKFPVWVIPVIIGVLLLVIILFILGLITFSYSTVSSKYKGGWICDNYINVDINTNRINIFGSDRSNVINAKYRMTKHSMVYGKNEFILKVKMFKKNGERYKNISDYKLIMYSNDMDHMSLTNLKTKEVYNCTKK